MGNSCSLGLLKCLSVFFVFSHLAIYGVGISFSLHHLLIIAYLYLFWLDVPIKEATSRHGYRCDFSIKSNKVSIPLITYTYIIVHYHGWYTYSQDKNTHIHQKAANRRILCTTYTFYGLIIRMTQKYSLIPFYFRECYTRSVCIVDLTHVFISGRPSYY